MSVKPITLENFNTIVIDEPGIKLLRFWASWCQPCVIMGPMYKNAAKELNNKALFGEVDVVSQPELANMHRIRSIPTIVVYKDNEVIDRVSGILNEKELATIVNRYARS